MFVLTPSKILKSARKWTKSLRSLILKFVFWALLTFLHQGLKVGVKVLKKKKFFWGCPSSTWLHLAFSILYSCPISIPKFLIHTQGWKYRSAICREGDKWVVFTISKNIDIDPSILTHRRHFWECFCDFFCLLLP